MGNPSRDFSQEFSWARPPVLGGRDVVCAADTEAGLPSNQIHQIAQDRYGRLWLAGPAGLACFDGHTVLAHDRRTGLACQGLRSVGIAPDGTVWIGTDQGLEAIDAHGKPLSWIGWSQWPYGLCESIEASGENVWIGGAQGIACIDMSNAQAPRVKFHADIGFVRHMVRLEDGGLYAASDTHGVVRVEGTSWRPMRYPCLRGRQVRRLAAGQPGELLVGTNAGLLVVELGTAHVLHALRLQDKSPDVTALACTANEIWVGFGRTVATFVLDAPNIQPATHYELASRVNDIMVDAHNNAWIGTDTAGLWRVSCLRHAIKRIDTGGRGAVFSIRPRTQERVDVGSDGLFSSLRLTEGGQSEPVQEPVPLATTVWDSLHTGQGHWLATHAGLYLATSNSSYLQMHADDPVLGAPARVLVERDGDLWVGTLRGLSVLRAGVPQEVRPADGRAFGYVYAMTLDAQKRLWLATLGRGLWRETETGWTQLLGGPLGTSGNTYAATPGPDGRVVVVQDENVVLLDPDKDYAPQVLQRYEPIAGWTAVWLDTDRIAIGASDGVRILNVADRQETMRVQCLVPGPEWEFTNNRALVVDDRGRLLCGINGGMVRVDLQRLQALLYLPSVRLLDLTWHGVTPRFADGVHRVSPGRWTLRARLTAPWFIDHAHLRFRFKLEGFDNEWSALQTSPVMGFTSLPPGTYHLLAQAWSPLTGFGDEIELCSITVLRPWWASGWLPGMGALDRAYQRWVGDEAATKALAERNLALEKEIAEREQGLRIANEALQSARAQLEHLTQTDELTQLPSPDRFDQQLQHELRRAWRLRVPVSLLIINVDGFRAINEVHGAAVGDAHLKAIAEIVRVQMREATDLACRMSGDEFALFLVGAYADETSQLAKRIQGALQALALPHPASPQALVTASFGIVTVKPGDVMSHHKMLARAGQAMQHIKQRGGNGIMIWSPALPLVTAAPTSPGQSPA